MNLNIPARDLQNKDAKVVLQAVMSRWLPLADTIFAMVVELLPNPISAQSERIIRLFPDNNELLCKDEVKSSLEKVRSAVKTCDYSANSPCIVFVSKMFAVPIDFLPKRGPNGELLPDLKEELNNLGDVGHGECFLAFARVFSGVLHAGQKILVLYPFHDPTKEELEKKHMQEAVVQGRGVPCTRIPSRDRSRALPDRSWDASSLFLSVRNRCPVHRHRCVSR